MIPSFFMAHGAPRIALEQNSYVDALKQVAKEFPQPRAIVLFSAHWEQPLQRISDIQSYETIHDFGGFSPELYQITYPAPGDPQLASKIATLLKAHNILYGFDTERGLDHGAWTILKRMYPDANIPVVAMSVNPAESPEEQYRIGRALAPLREKDVMIIGSGGTVHNLSTLRMTDTVDPWAQAFEDWIEEKLEKWDLAALFSYEAEAPFAEQAVPTKEHLIPLFYAMGAADDEKKARRDHLFYQYGNLSYSLWRFGK